MGIESRTLQARTVYRQEVAPADQEVLWVDTSGSSPVLKQYYPNDGKWAKVVQVGSGIQKYDTAETFEESNLTLSTSTVFVDGNSLAIDDVLLGNKVGIGSDETADGNNEGITINPNSDLSGIQVSLSGNTPLSSVDEYRVQEVSSGDYLAQVPADNDPQIIEVDLAANSEYHLRTYNSSGQFTQEYNTATSVPQTGEWVDVTGAPNQYDTLWSFGGVTAYGPAANGSATLEWNDPAAKYDWDLVTYTKAEDGETVEVYVAYSEDGGSTWSRTNSGAPVSRNYDLSEDGNISSDDLVRIEVELSRSNRYNNPTLESAHRSWFV